jgi:hypothetical protein
MMTIVDDVECYGVLEENSNFLVLCSNEEDDFEWLSRDPNKLRNWDDIVDHLKGKGLEVVEISTL